MNKPALRFMRNEDIEDITAQRLRQYEAKIGAVVRFPIPAEEIIEQVLNLSILWDEIEEHPGELILAGLQRQTRTIIMNEKHLELFEGKPGLRNSTLTHEAGHADLEGGLGDQGPTLFEEAGERIVKRHSTKINQQLEILYDLALRNETAYRLLRQITEGQDTPEQKSAVDRYQSAFLMPKWLLREAAQQYDLTRWQDLYALAGKAQVSISNLTVRLQRLGLIYLRKGDKKIYRSQDEANGQRTLF